MSRTKHPRPVGEQQDALSRVTQAAISAADTFNRFERDVERLQRATDGAIEQGFDYSAITIAVNQAGRGRADRLKALRTIAARAMARTSGET